MRYQFNQYSEIIQQLKASQIIALPTDTVFGLAALASSEMAVQRLREVKQRPQEKVFSYMVANLEMIEEVCELTNRDRFIVSNLLPGAWTFIFRKKQPNPLIDNGLETIAIRIPDLVETVEIIKHLGTGIYMPSANISGQPALVKADDVFATFAGQIAGVLDIDAANGRESTIVDCTQEELVLVRQGVMDMDIIHKKMKEFI